MSGSYKFSATIEAADRGGAYIEIPFDVEATFGKKRVPVIATIDGVPYRGSLVRMGGECHVLGILKAIRTSIGKQAGDSVDVVLEEDVAPRVVDVPPDLREALGAKPKADHGFAALSYSHKRQYVEWITSAKSDETRQRRIAKTVATLSAEAGTSEKGDSPIVASRQDMHPTRRGTHGGTSHGPQ